MDIVKKYFETSIKLEDHYRDFWKKIYHNDAYIFFKNAIEFYKNTQNHKFHEFYNSVINKRLYTGKCIVVMDDMLRTFSNKNKLSSDELCNLTIQVINILDYVFEYCPRLPFDTVVFRFLTLHNDDLLLNLKEGDYYRELGINSTSLNPYYSWVDRWGMKSWHDPKLEKKVFLTIILPKDTKCYYMNIPFTYNDTKGFLNEFEIVLPRDCVYLIKSKKEFKDRYFFTLELVCQVPTKDRPIDGIEEKLPTRNPTKDELKKWGIKKDKKKYKMEECNWFLTMAKKSYEKWEKLPENQKYEPEKDIYEDIHPKKFWLYVFRNPRFWENETKENNNFLDLQKNAKNITIKKDDVLTNKDFLYLPNKLSAGFNFYYTTKNNNKLKNKFYEVDKKSPLLYLVEVDKGKKMNVKKDFTYWYKAKNIKLKINDIKYENIIDDYNYGIVKAEML